MYDADNYQQSRGIMNNGGSMMSASKKTMNGLYNPPSKMIKGIKGNPNIIEYFENKIQII